MLYIYEAFQSLSRADLLGFIGLLPQTATEGQSSQDLTAGY